MCKIVTLSLLRKKLCATATSQKNWGEVCVIVAQAEAKTYFATLFTSYTNSNKSLLHLKKLHYTQFPEETILIPSQQFLATFTARNHSKIEDQKLLYSSANKTALIQLSHFFRQIQHILATLTILIANGIFGWHNMTVDG